jgi:hypothetical protein
MAFSAIVLAALGACIDLGPHPPAMGNYDLLLVDGKVLPTTYRPANGATVTVLLGTLTLVPNPDSITGTYTFARVWSDSAGGALSPSRTTTCTGKWSSFNTAMQFDETTGAGCGGSFKATYFSSKQLELRYADFKGTFSH